MLKTIVFALLATSAAAAECNVDCRAECAGYSAEKPRPRIFNACITGCESGKKGQCSKCSSVPKPHPRTNKICGKACKSSGKQMRACERAQRKKPIETIIVEEITPEAEVVAEVAAVAQAARVEQKALDDEI